MDPLHTTTKTTTTPTITSPPPAYSLDANDTAANDINDTNPAADHDANDANLDTDKDPPPTTTLHLNASTQIRGSHNLISVAPLDVPRFSALFLTLLRQQPGRARANLNLQLNCSVAVVGERNVLGTGLGVMGVRARVAVQEVQGAQEAQGVGKRRAREVGGSFLFGV
ncbi:hypothetical protein V2W45_1396276 [Cenococcum geophilum]